MMNQDYSYGVYGRSFEYDFHGYGEFEKQVNTNLPYNSYNENPNHYPNSPQNSYNQYHPQPHYYPNHIKPKDEQNYDIQMLILQMMKDQQSFITSMMESNQIQDKVIIEIFNNHANLSSHIAQLEATQVIIMEAWKENGVKERTKKEEFEKQPTFLSTQPPNSKNNLYDHEFETFTFDVEGRSKESNALNSCDHEKIVFIEEDTRLTKPSILNLCEYESFTFDVDVDVLKEELSRGSEEHNHDLCRGIDEMEIESFFDSWDHEDTLLEEPILEKFEFNLWEEDNCLSTMEHEDLMEPIMESMIFGDDMEDLIQKVKVSYKSYLIEKLKNKLASEVPCEDSTSKRATIEPPPHKNHFYSPTILEGMSKNIPSTLEGDGREWKPPDKDKVDYKSKDSNAKSKARRRAFNKFYLKPRWPSPSLTSPTTYLCSFKSFSSIFDQLLRALCKIGSSEKFDGVLT